MPAKVRQVALVLVEQAVQAHGGVVMGGPAEGAEAERNIKARLAHRAVAFVEVAAQAIAMGPCEPAHHGVAGIATGFGELCLLRWRWRLWRGDQVAGVDLGMSDQPIDDIDVVVAVVGDIGHRALRRYRNTGPGRFARRGECSLSQKS